MGEMLLVRVPDIGDFDEVAIAEVLVRVGDTVKANDSLVTLESDKASMEVPSPAAGVVKEIAVKVGDRVGQNAAIATLEVGESAAQPSSGAPKPAAEPAPATPAPAKPAPPPAAPAPAPSAPALEAPAESPSAETGAEDRAEPTGEAASPIYASPVVRKLARELGVDLGKVHGTGRHGRTSLEDVAAYAKAAIQHAGPAASGGGGVAGFAWPVMPEIDFSKYGPIEVKPLHRIRKLSAAHVHRSWLHVPHVTQFEEADITEMEAFRKSQADDAQKHGVKLTPVAFLLKATAAALKAFPDFNSSLDKTGENLILKQYVHIGVAVDTPNGLVVPVIRDVDRKGLYDLARDLGEVSGRAREGKLLPKDMQGAGFTISSLGGVGGTAFTPIVNAPEVAILGVSRSSMKPVYQNNAFVPRLMLPLSLSYDHRVIDGAMAARFVVALSGLLSDIRRLLL